MLLSNLDCLSSSLLNNLLAGRGATKRRAPMLSRSNSASGRRSLQGSGMNIDSDKHVQVTLPDNQVNRSRGNKGREKIQMIDDRY